MTEVDKFGLVNTLSGKSKIAFFTYIDGSPLPRGYVRVESLKKVPGKFYYYNYIFKFAQWKVPIESFPNKHKKVFFEDFDAIPINTPVGPGIPTEFIGLADSVNLLAPEDCEQNEIWQKMESVGKGSYGQVYVACKDEDCNYVVKIQNADNHFFQEVRALQELQITNTVPKIFASWTCKNVGYIVMEKLTSTRYYKPKMTSSKIWKDLGSLLTILEKAGWLHIDTSESNVMITDEGKLVLIDFGLSVKKTELNEKQTYPEHLHSKNYKRDLTWDQLKSYQEYKYQNSFNPCADPYSEAYLDCSDEQEKNFKYANAKWYEILKTG